MRQERDATADARGWHGSAEPQDRASASADGEERAASAGRQEPAASGGGQEGAAPPGRQAWEALVREQPGTPPGREARDLSVGEIRDLIQRNNWGVLATSAYDQPYAVPVIYGFDGEFFYVANSPGRKVRNLEANPSVCLTIAEVENGGVRWRSVVVIGRVEWIEEVSGRLHAFNVLRKQHGDRPRRSVRDAARLARARVVRIIPTEITGRAKD